MKSLSKAQDEVSKGTEGIKELQDNREKEKPMKVKQVLLSLYKKMRGNRQ